MQGTQFLNRQQQQPQQLLRRSVQQLYQWQHFTYSMQYICSMYNLPYFKEQDRAVVMQFIKTHPFATLIGVGNNNCPAATQVPLFIDEREGKLFLSGHIQRKTDHHLAFEHNPNVLALFTGAHAYISASWYTNHKVASTWNYMSVQAKGILRFTDETALLEILRRTTAHFENNPQSPALVEKMDDDYIAKMMKAIVAFEIEVTTLEHTFKLSQNRDVESYDTIITQLTAQGGDGAIIAAEMLHRRSQLFNA
jgi:transcriptional regulator